MLVCSNGFQCKVVGGFENPPIASWDEATDIVLKMSWIHICIIPKVIV